jgi:hypothetical protein
VNGSARSNAVGVHEVDAAADRVGVVVGGDRLHHLDRRDEVGRDGVERDAAAPPPRDADDVAVDRHLVEVGIDAADDDVARLALVDLDRDAGEALQRLGGVEVGKLADVIAATTSAIVGSARLRSIAFSRAAREL